MAKKVSQQMIADRLGISQAIVSGILSNKPVRASEDTRQKIFDIAKELGYKRPKMNKRKSPDLIAFIIHSEQWEELLPVTRGIRSFLEATNTLIVQHEWLTDDIPTTLLDNIKGCLCVSAEFTQNQKAVDVFATKVPMTFILTHDRDYKFDNVFPGYRVAYHKALKHLEGLGHRRFGYFGIRKMGMAQTERAAGFLGAVLDLDDAEFKSEWLYLPLRNEPVDSDTQRLLSEYADFLLADPQRPTALFFEAESYLRIFKKVVAQRDLKELRDICCVGYDEQGRNKADYSCLATDWEMVGYTAIKALHDRIANPQKPVVEHRVPALFIPKGDLTPPKYPS